tara:strand:+ start:202 stop:402 length:201 start_codon:yes stop_codon:yes gene_type:complete
MDSAKLSHLYFIASSRSAEVLSNLYETLHSKEGVPLDEYDEVKALVQSAVKEIRQELSLIYAAVEE